MKHFKEGIDYAIASGVVVIVGAAILTWWALERGGISIYPVSFPYEYSIDQSSGTMSRSAHGQHFAYAAILCDPLNLPFQDSFSVETSGLQHIQILSDRGTLIDSSAGPTNAYENSLSIGGLKFSGAEGAAVLISGDSGKSKPSAEVLRIGREGLLAADSPRRAYMLSWEEIGFVFLVGILIGAVAKPSWSRITQAIAKANEFDRTQRAKASPRRIQPRSGRVTTAQKANPKSGGLTPE